MNPPRSYVVVLSVASNANGQTNALTRDGVQLEMAMRLVANGKKAKEAWGLAARFVEEMDNYLPPLPTPEKE